MTDLRKAAGVAYEVPLHELLEGVPENARLIIDSEDGMSTRFIPVGHLCKRAAEALRQALAQPEQEPVAWLIQYKDRHEFVWCNKTVSFKEQVLGIEPLYTAPVDAVNISQERVDETAKGEHEPVAFVTIEPALDGDWRKCPSIKWVDKPIAGPLYTAPPKREWVGLTDDDVHDAFNYVEMVKLLDFDRDRPEWCEAFASACEARLRHKNGGNK